MTRPAISPARNSPDGRAPALAPAAPAQPGHRRRGMLAAAVILVCGGALAFGSLFVSASHRVPVLVAARNIPAGSVLTAGDLKTSDASVGPGVASIPARQESQVTGQAAAVGIPAGTMLSAGDLTATPEPRPGHQLVAVGFKTSQVPAGLAPGQPVLVFPTAGASGQPGTSQGQAPLATSVPATVYQVSAPDQSGTVTVNLDVLAPAGPAVENQATLGQIGIVETSRGK